MTSMSVTRTMVPKGAFVKGHTYAIAREAGKAPSRAMANAIREVTVTEGTPVKYEMRTRMMENAAPPPHPRETK